MYRSLVGWPVAEAAQGFWCGFFGGWRVVGEVAACRRRNTGRRAAGGDEAFECWRHWLPHTALNAFSGILQ
jgi:hypothetical protein